MLTDGALGLLPQLVDIPEEAVKSTTSYVGYADLDRAHPWTEGLYKRARQMFDPVGLGYPLLMERDQYWPCNPTCDESGTQNSAPARTVDRAAWEKLGGVTVGTADPLGGKAPGEGTKRDKTSIGTLQRRQGPDRRLRRAAAAADRELRPLVRRQPVHGLDPRPAAAAARAALERRPVPRPAVVAPLRRSAGAASAASASATPAPSCCASLASGHGVSRRVQTATACAAAAAW